MDIQPIIHFLKGIRENNNRDWFQAHKSEFNDCRKEFEEGIAQLILRISAFDEEIANQRAADCIYRFYRDLRFTQDKTPYKRHFGAYICQKGRKSLRGGYYVHIEPDKCLLAGGCYYLPNNILTACRNEILANSDEWLACVANKNSSTYLANQTKARGTRMKYQKKDSVCRHSKLHQKAFQPTLRFSPISA